MEDEHKKQVTVDNPAYLAWIARDQQVLRFLLNSLSPDILSHVLAMTSTAEAWKSINNMFASASRSKVQHLRTRLQETKKLNMTADQYFTLMKGFASELTALGKTIEDDEVLGYILQGLDRVHYNSLITAVNGNTSTTLDNLYDQLYAYDMRNAPTEEISFSSSANIARRDDDRSRVRSPDRDRRDDRGGNGGGGGGSGYRRDHRDDDRRDNWRRNERRDDDRRDGRDGWHRDERRGDDRRDRRSGRVDSRQGRSRQDRAPTPYVNTDCQICKIHGHPASDCWWRYADDDKNDNGGRGEKSAHVASYTVEPGVESPWYSDTGATDHITGQLNKLSTHDKYIGNDRVHTAEGSGPSHTKNPV